MHLVTHSIGSGKGKCPYSPHEPFTGLIIGKRTESGEKNLANAVMQIFKTKSIASSPAVASGLTYVLFSNGFSLVFVNYCILSNLLLPWVPFRDKGGIQIK